MSRFFYIAVFCIIFFSCKKNSPSGCTEDIYTYEFYTSSKIDTILNDAGLFFQVNPGNDLVFVYSHTGPSCESIIDEEYTDKLVFKVPAAANSFYYQNNQLADALCLFRKIAWWQYGATRITSGYVTGTKISATKWEVEINVEIGGSTGRLSLKKAFFLH